ncbi:ankyrin repeat domain-containing protein [Parashewanella spongiae]|uniref:ankyrin repeat domain-containing protein n=1 Tax=Parashewanella spongiae TaxID=342950 RepID=UPI0014777A94|nr:ankyrin repeat domain-containing protein [Parashewanella spongiae]
MDVLLSETDKCTGGVRSNAQRALTELKMSLAGVDGLVQKARKTLITNWAAEAAKKQCIKSKCDIGNQVHYANVFYNSVASEFGLFFCTDTYLEQCEIDIGSDRLEEFRREIRIIVSPSAIVTLLSEEYAQALIDVLQKNKFLNNNGQLVLTKMNGEHWQKDVEINVLEPLKLLTRNQNFSLHDLINVEDFETVSGLIRLDLINITNKLHKTIAKSFAEDRPIFDNKPFRLFLVKSPYSTDTLCSDDGLYFYIENNKGQRAVVLDDLSQIDLMLSFSAEISVALINQAARNSVKFEQMKMFIEKHLVLSSAPSLTQSHYFRCLANRISSSQPLNEGLKSWLEDNRSVLHVMFTMHLGIPEAYALAIEESAKCCSLSSDLMPRDLPTLALLSEQFISEHYSTHELKEFRAMSLNQDNLSAYLKIKNVIEKIPVDTLSTEESASNKSIFVFSLVTHNSQAILLHYLKSNQELINIKSGRKTLLMEACYQGSSTSVKVLSNQPNCEPNFVDKKGNQALHLACQKGNVESVRNLLKNKRVAVGIKNFEGLLPLHIAVKNGFLTIAEAIISYDSIVIGLQDSKGNTALHYACKYKHLELIKLLLSKGINALQVNHQGETAFYVACEVGNELCVSLLLNHEPKIVNNQSITCHEKEDNTVKDSSDAEEKSGLHIAIECGHIAIVRQVLASASLTTDAIIHGLNHAIRYRKLEMIGLFSEKVTDITKSAKSGDLWCPIDVAASSNRIDIWDAVIQLDSRDIKVRDTNGQLLLRRPDGYSPMHFIAVHNACVLFEHIIGSVELSLLDVTYYGLTPLFSACNRGKNDIIKKILERNLSYLNILNKKGESVLDIAITENRLSTVYLLLEYDISPEIIYSGVVTALKKGNPDIVCALVGRVSEHQVDPLFSKVTNSSVQIDNSLLQLAVESNNITIITLVLSMANRSMGDTISPCHPSLLHLASANSFNFDPDIMLASKRLRLSQKSETQESILNIFSDEAISDESKKELVRSLVSSKRLDVAGITDRDGNTLIHILLLHNYRDELINYLKTFDSDTYMKNEIGEAPLELAISIYPNDIELISLLLERDAREGDFLAKVTPFISTDRDINQAKTIFNILIKKEQLLSSFVDDKGNTLLHLGARYCTCETWEKILLMTEWDFDCRNDNDEPSILLALKNNDPKVFLDLVHIAPDFCYISKTGKSLLQLSLDSYKRKYFLKLLSSGKNVMINHRDNGGNTILHCACLSGSYIEISAVLNYQAHLMMNDIKVTKDSDEFEIVSVEDVKRGSFQPQDFEANVFLKNAKKQTPLHFTASRGLTESSRLLLQKGAALCLRQKCGEGKTPMWYASKKLDKSMYEMFKAAESANPKK